MTFAPIFTESIAATFTIKIWIAGDYDTARAAARKFASGRGFCVALQRCDYIYTGGEESGLCATIINYPRFPKEPEALILLAEEFALDLCTELHQASYSIETPSETRFCSRRQ